MSDNTNNSIFNSVDLSELFQFLLKQRKSYILATILLGLTSSCIAMFLPKIWVSDALVMEVGGGNKKGNSAGMLAELTGINLGSQSGKTLDLVKRRLMTKDFYKHMITINPDFYRDLVAVKAFDEELRLNIYNSEIYNLKNTAWVAEPSFLDGYKIYLNTVKAGFLDEKTGNFLVIRAEHRSPITAQFLVQQVVSQINELKRKEDIEDAVSTLDYLQKEILKTNQISIKAAINGLIENQVKTKTFAYVNKAYVIKPLDTAYIPEKRSKPNRKNFVIFFTFIGLFSLTLFYCIQVFLQKK